MSKFAAVSEIKIHFAHHDCQVAAGPKPAQKPRCTGTLPFSFGLAFNKGGPVAMAWCPRRTVLRSRSRHAVEAKLEDMAIQRVFGFKLVLLNNFIAWMLRRKPRVF